VFDGGVLREKATNGNRGRKLEAFAKKNRAATRRKLKKGLRNL